jgi:Concanavalin A-like lectin/glucanases superfamily
MIFLEIAKHFRVKTVLVFLSSIFLTNAAYCQIDFWAYYTIINTGEKREAYSRTGEKSDVIVKISTAEGKLIFCRGNSYLPYWETKIGKWDLPEIIPRKGDGVNPMPDRSNVYSYVRIIESKESLVIVHWRYLSNFTSGNPHTNVDQKNFVDEVFKITPNERVTRTIKKGTDKIDDWNNTLNKTIQVLQLNLDGVQEISRTNPGHSVSIKKLNGNSVRGPALIMPSLWFKSDEASGDSTKENLSGLFYRVPGEETLWKKGISGTALEFDGYKTVISVPAAMAPQLSGGSLTLEGWFALGAYPYCMEGTYDKNDGMMRLYINGKEVAVKFAGKGGVQAISTELRIGKANVLLAPTEGTNTNLPGEFGFDGLIGEIRVYNIALNHSQIESSFDTFNPGTVISLNPDMQKRRFPVVPINKKFGVFYT